MTDRFITTEDGLRLAVSERGEPSGPPVVFIHGYPDCKDLWAEVMSNIEHDLHLIAYDVRGTGASDAPRGIRGYDFDRLGDDLMAVIDAAAPGRRVHLVGHDWGGLQGWEFATSARFASVLASFTAVAAPQLDQVLAGNRSLLAEGRVLKALSRGRRSWYILALLTPGLVTVTWRGLLTGGRWQRLLRAREGVASYQHPTLGRDGVNGANLYRRNVPRRMLRPRVDTAAHVPVQLIVPRRDRYIPPAYYERVHEHAPSLRRHDVDAGHWLPLAEPALVASLVAEFVHDVEAGQI